MAFEGQLGKVWVNVCDSFQKLGTLVSSVASPEVEKEAAINSLTDREKWSV